MSYLNRARWITDKYIYIMLGLFPLFFGLQGYSDITRSKSFFFLYVTGAWLSAVFLLLLSAALHREKFGFVFRPVHYALAAFMVVAAFSALLSPWWQVTILGANRYDGLLTELFYALSFYGVSLLARPKRSYLWVMTAAVSACCLVAVLQLFGLDPLSLYPEGTNYYDKYGAYNGAFLGTMGNVGILGQYLCITLPVIFVCALRSEKPREKYTLLAVSLLSGCVLAFSHVEASYVGVLACALISIPALMKSPERRKIFLWIVGVLLFLGLLVVFFWPGESGTVWELSRILHLDIRDEFGSHRVQIWREALALVKERPLIGGGPGTFSERVNIVWSRYVEEIQKTRTVKVSNAHNAYIARLVNEGILGLCAYLTALGCGLLTWVERKDIKGTWGALGCGILCAAVQDFFCVTLCLVTPLMWILWGLMEAPLEDDLVSAGL